MTSKTAAPRTPASKATAAACPISPVVDLVFSRWTTPVLWALNESGRLRFVELERRPRRRHREGAHRSGCASLSGTGSSAGTTTRRCSPRVEYEITSLGRSLSPVFAALGEWSAAHLPAVEAARSAYAGRCRAKAGQLSPSRVSGQQISVRHAVTSGVARGSAR